jgi:polyisoprenoid-binding protein YceI
MLLKFTSLAAMFVLAPAIAGAVDRYTIDPQHTFPSFEFSHMGLSVWRGKFDRSHGEITLDRSAKTGTVTVSIDPASINFGLDIMDDKARSEDFFDVKKYPKASYKGVVRFEGDQPSAVDGEITLMGVTRPVKLSIKSFRCMPHPMSKKELCGADAEGEVNWSQFGMKWSKYGEGEMGRVLLRIQVEGLKED